MIRTFFTADLHFGHKNIIRYCDRPFDNVDEMDNMIISYWNQMIKPNDIVWLLGDVMLNNNEEYAGKILSQLNGRIRLVLGNHDYRFKKLNLHEYFDEIHDGIVERKFYSEKTKKNHSFVMCHYPLLTWNKSYHGSIHLHGHCHGNIPYDPSIRRLDVGVDCFKFCPVDMDTIFDIMNITE